MIELSESFLIINFFMLSPYKLSELSILLILGKSSELPRNFGDCHTVDKPKGFGSRRRRGGALNFNYVISIQL